MATVGRIPSLDGVRAVAVLLVIAGHLLSGRGGALLLAIFGVHTFFVLSGYLITRLLQAEWQHNGKIDLVAFYRRRSFRIFPAAFTYILIIALFCPNVRSGLIYALTYTVSYHFVGTPLYFQHLWSLSVEEQFYLLWPLGLVLAFQHRAKIAWITMLIAAAFRLTVALGSPGYQSAFVHFSFPGTMDSIAAGCLLAVYEPWIRERLSWMTDSIAVVTALPLTAWVVEVTCWADVSETTARSLTVFWGAVPLLIALWIFILVERRDRILNNRIASTIGVLSYSLYLWQQPFLVERKFSALVSILMLSGCAVASYGLIERPMLRLGAAIQQRRRVPECSHDALVSSS